MKYMYTDINNWRCNLHPVNNTSALSINFKYIYVP